MFFIRGIKRLILDIMLVRRIHASFLKADHDWVMDTSGYSNTTFFSDTLFISESLGITFNFSSDGELRIIGPFSDHRNGSLVISPMIARGLLRTVFRLVSDDVGENRGGLVPSPYSDGVYEHLQRQKKTKFLIRLLNGEFRSRTTINGESIMEVRQRMRECKQETFIVYNKYQKAQIEVTVYFANDSDAVLFRLGS